MTDLVILRRGDLNCAIEALEEAQKTGIHDPCIDIALFSLKDKFQDLDPVIHNIVDTIRKMVTGEIDIDDYLAQAESYRDLRAMEEEQQRVIDFEHYVLGPAYYRETMCQICGRGPDRGRGGNGSCPMTDGLVEECREKEESEM